MKLPGQRCVVAGLSRVRRRRASQAEGPVGDTTEELKKFASSQNTGKSAGGG